MKETCMTKTKTVRIGVATCCLVMMLWAPGLLVAGGQKVTCTTCPVTDVDPHASKALGPVTASGSHACKAQEKNGFPVPDPACTPGAVNPTVTVAVLRNPKFRTGCVRDCETTLAKKATTYDNYGIPHPANNSGATQTCELDHLVSLELGGADTLDNLWPQCGPGNVSLAQRFFKQKDRVENFLAAQVKSGAMDLETAQKGIAEDWTQFLPEAKAFCASHGC
jgi:hypothetical protein